MSGLKTYERLNVGAVTAIFLNGSPETQTKISNGGSKKVFYKNAADVDVEDTEIAAGASATLAEPVWVISESTGAHITVEHLEGPTFQDLTIGDDLTVTDDLLVSGKGTVTETLEVGEGVTAKKSLTVKEGATVEGALTAKKGATVEEALTVKKGATVEEGLTVKKTATLEEAVTAKKGLTVEEGLTVKKAGTVEEAFEAKKGATIGEKLTAKGEIEGAKALKVKEGSTLEGAVEAKKTLKVGEGSTLEGTVEAKGAATVGTTLGVTGATTPTGGVVSAGGPPGAWAGGWVPQTAETGTDTAIAEKKLFLTSVFLPANKKLKGVAFLVGSVGGKGKVVMGLFDATGELLAKSSETEEGTTTGTAKEIQKLAFTAEYSAVGPKTYFVGLTGNNAEDKFRTIPSNTASDNVWTAEKELAVKNTMAKFTEPPSTFTGAVGPIGMLY